MKLVVEEAESRALRKLLGDWPARVSSVIAAVEVARAARLHPVRRASERAGRLIRDLHLVPLDAQVVATAGAAAPSSLRTLDAVHLVTALSLGPAVGGFVTYDRRLAAVAAAAGLPVLGPD